jgi:hypothetical protein
MLDDTEDKRWMLNDTEDRVCTMGFLEAAWLCVSKLGGSSAREMKVNFVEVVRFVSPACITLNRCECLRMT